MAKKNAMASKVEYAVKELQTKLDVKRTTEELKVKLMAKSKLRNSNLRSKSESLENLPVAKNIEETHQRQRIESNQGYALYVKLAKNFKVCLLKTQYFSLDFGNLNSIYLI